MKKCIVMHKADTVATALDALLLEMLSGSSMRTCGTSGVGGQEAIPLVIKSLSDHAEGAGVVKYGQVIGRAVERIESGRHAHVHNVASLYTLG